MEYLATLDDDAAATFQRMHAEEVDAIASKTLDDAEKSQALSAQVLDASARALEEHAKAEISGAKAGGVLGTILMVVVLYWLLSSL